MARRKKPSPPPLSPEEWRLELVKRSSHPDAKRQRPYAEADAKAGRRREKLRLKEERAWLKKQKPLTPEELAELNRLPPIDPGLARYHALAEKLLGRPPLEAPLPDPHDDKPEPVYPGDLWVKDEQALAAAVCKRTKMTPQLWATLDLAGRLPWMEEAAATPPQLPTVWFHGGQSYSLDGVTPALVSTEQHNVLQAFLDKDQAIGTKELGKAGVCNVAVVVGKIIEVFGAGPVRRPPHKNGGYFIRVRSKSR